MSKTDDGLHELLMTWGAYRSGYTRLGLGYGQSLLGRLIGDMKGTTSTRCIGRGKVRDIVSNSWAPCPVCRGKGRVVLDGRGKANPALIRGTKRDTTGEDEPEIIGRIDRAIQKLVVRHRIVLVTRYVVHPRRNDGDKRLKHVNHWLGRLGEQPISKRRMENLLSE
ncbi:MAG: hypothetical protein DWQ08_01350, partial [Proteobacteria bacterium]